MAKTPKVQVKLYVEDTLSQSLRDDAEEFGLSSAQEVIEEILRLYRPFWRKMKTAQRDAYEQQAADMGIDLGKQRAPASSTPTPKARAR